MSKKAAEHPISDDSNHNSGDSVYPSKIDWWVGALIILAPLIHLPLGVLVMMKGHPVFGVMLIFWGLIIFVIILAFSWPCRYEITNTQMTIRSGMISDPIRIKSIEQMNQNRSWMASPALSLDRIELKLSDGTTRLISPRDKEGFIAAVKARQA